MSKPFCQISNGEWDCNSEYYIKDFELKWYSYETTSSSQEYINKYD